MNTLINRIPAQVRNAVSSMRVTEFVPLDMDPNDFDAFERYQAQLDRDFTVAFPNAHLSFQRCASLTPRPPKIEVWADNDDNELDALVHAQVIQQACSYDAFGF